jgi:O-antigen/teichoic acid export membrane protein
LSGTTLAEGAAPGATGRVRRLLQDPLLRGAYSLIASHGITSVLGLAYWIVAARLLPAEIVGANAAVLAAVLLLSELAQLNLTSVLPRYLPVAGRSGPRLVRRAYQASITAAVVLMGVAVATGRPAAVLDGADPWAVAGVVLLGGVVWTAFTVQDSVLVGVRRAPWVPVENGVFSLLKIVTLPLFVVVAEPLSVLLSWAIPALACVLVVTPLAYGAVRRLARVDGSATAGRLDRRALMRFTVWDFTANMAYRASTLLLPTVVLVVLDAPAAAVLYVAWQITAPVVLASNALATSWTVEGAGVGASGPGAAVVLATQARVALRHFAFVAVPLVAVGVAGAGLLLRAFGSDYAGQGSTLLRLLLIGALPAGVVGVVTGWYRVTGQVRELAAVQGAAGAGVLIGAFVLSGPLGLAGAGVAWVLSQSMAAAFVLIRVARASRS